MRKLWLALLCVALAACATFAPRRYERAAEQIAGLVNSGQAAELARMSRAPFLLDGELLLLERDVATFWDGVTRAGFRIDPSATATATPVDAQTYIRFASTMEVKTFFQSYVSKKGFVVELDAGRARILLLLDRGKGGRTQIVGFKGPDAI
jgi:hypothetical protein